MEFYSCIQMLSFIYGFNYYLEDTSSQYAQNIEFCFVLLLTTLSFMRWANVCTELFLGTCEHLPAPRHRKFLISSCIHSSLKLSLAIHCEKPFCCHSVPTTSVPNRTRNRVLMHLGLLCISVLL